MRGTTITILALLLLACITSGPTLAQSVHFKHGSPQSTDNGLTLTVFGALSGLGNGDLRLRVAASGNPTANCCNPSGQCKVPGQNPAAATVTSGIQVIPGSQIKNGTTPFTDTTNSPTTPIPGAPECPGSSWTENILDMAFTQAGLQIQQSSGGVFTDVIAACITYSPATANGAVSSANLSVVVGDLSGGTLGSCPAALFPGF